MLLAAMVAMMLVAAAPAMASSTIDIDNSFNKDFSQNLSQFSTINLQDIESGDANAAVFQVGTATGGDAISTGDGDATGGDAIVVNNASIEQDTGISISVIQQSIQAGDDAFGKISFSW